MPDAVDADAPRRVIITQTNTAWKLNGRGFDMMAVTDDEKVKAEVLEVWKIINGVNPGETVQPLMRFPNNLGVYVYHCHNLEHADHGVMRNHVIEA